MKKLLFAVIMLNGITNYAAEHKLKRSEEVIAKVWTATNLAVCNTTAKFFHDKCQLNRLTQKCPSCPCWDVEFVPCLTVALKPVITCELCDKEVEFVAGFAKIRPS